MIHIALFGDSIGRGVSYQEDRGRYAYLKEGFDKLTEQHGLCKVYNYAKFGATAKEGLEAFAGENIDDVQAVAIQYGGNDCTPDWAAIAKDPDSFHPPKTDLDSFEAQLTQFVEKVRGAGKVAVLVTPPPLVAERFVPWISKGLDEAAILRYLGDVHHVYRWQEQYGLAVHKVARLTQSKLFDLRAFFLLERRLEDLYCADGMHPNALGHQVIYKAIEQMLPRFTQKEIKACYELVNACVSETKLEQMRSAGASQNVQRLEMYIENHFTEPLCVQDIANALGLSASRVCALANQIEPGMTIIKLLTQKRIATAKTLLRTTKATIREIAERVGIPDYNYFTKVFKKHTGKTPSQYRNSGA
ncbi:MAG TPA: helix-turn-helix domain-containing protein [Clostridiales bacterium]|nr:helix-turn-helix domain-containing protein [Clostridiales bacterium]